MGNSFDREHIAKVAKDLGLTVVFDSETPGVRTTNGSFKSWEEIGADIFSGLGIDLSDSND